MNWRWYTNAQAEASKDLKDLLNKAIARELQVSVQYMWQHVMWSRNKGFAVKEEFKKIAIAEMKQAEQLAERLLYLADCPTTKPEPITIGENLKEMIALDMKDDEGVIELYREIINLPGKRETRPPTDCSAIFSRRRSTTIISAL